jgi:hypothetical protein
MKRFLAFFALVSSLFLFLSKSPPLSSQSSALTYPIVDTGQDKCFNDWFEIYCPKPGEPFFGQDAQYIGNQPRYKDNGDGTITDLVTGLMWQKDPGEKKTYEEAVKGAKECRTGGYKDWRLPTIKELYSLILFSGTDPDPLSIDTSQLKPFLDTRYFVFRYGDPSKGERIIDAQYVSSTTYVGRIMWGEEGVFGVNFADGRIKCYPKRMKFFVRYVRGNPNYGKNRFVDNGDGTVTDLATGLMWQKKDSGRGMTWEEALHYAENLKLAGYDDWRLPNAKELQSIVDYTRSPDTTNSPAIDPVFECTKIINERGEVDYPYYWTSTTHMRAGSGGSAVYIAFGRGLGWMWNPFLNSYELLDVHGAGCQRSDPKKGDPSAYPFGRGPQGDVVRIKNFVRCVRGGAKLRD